MCNNIGYFLFGAQSLFLWKWPSREVKKHGSFTDATESNMLKIRAAGPKSVFSLCRKLPVNNKRMLPQYALWVDITVGRVRVDSWKV